MKIFSDIDLVRRYRSGDKDAFEEILNRYRDQVYTYFARKCRLPDEADDLAQETFIRLFKDLEKPDATHDDSLGPLIQKMMTATVWDRSRRQSRQEKAFEKLAKKTPQQPLPSDAEFEAGELADRMLAILNDASPLLVEPARLVLIHGYTHKEAAAELGVDRTVVSDRVLRAKKILAARLTQERKGLDHAH